MVSNNPNGGKVKDPIFYIVVSLLVSSKARPPLGVGRAREVIA